MITPQNLDKWMFDYFEGNLSGKELEAFEKFMLNNPEFEMDADAWEQAAVTQETIVYPHLASLERKRKGAVAWYGWASAATIALLIGFSVFYFGGEDTLILDTKAAVNNPITPKNSSESQLQSPDLSTNTFENIGAENVQNQTDASTNLYVSNPVNNSSFFTMLNGNGTTNNNISPVMEIESENQSIWNESHNTAVKSDNADLALTEAKHKFLSEEGKGTYVNNPSINPLGYSVKYSKSVTYNAFAKKVKNVYRKIERTMGYPVGLKNLRDPELIIPQNTLGSFNPGFTGGMLASRFDLNYRNQFFGNDLNTQELNLSFDSYVREMRGGVGVLVNVKDYGMGSFTDMNFSLLYSPKFKLNENVVFEPAVKLTLGTLSANSDNLVSSFEFELERGQLLRTGDLTGKSGFQRNWYKDYGLGGVLNTTWFYAGFSADNLGGHYRNVFANESTGLPDVAAVKYNAVLGSDYENRQETMTFSPFVTYTKQGDFQEAWAGLNYRFYWLTLGGGISTNLNYTASFGVKFDKFKLVYRYDNANSMITNDPIASHNIGIRFNTKQKSTRIK